MKRSKQLATRPHLNSIEAQLYVADMEASCAFYASKLGFGMPSSMAIRRFTDKYIGTMHD